MRTVTVYHKDGTKTQVDAKAQRASYDAVVNIPFHERLLKDYYKLELSGALAHDKDLSRPGAKERIRQVHERALEAGQ